MSGVKGQLSAANVAVGTFAGNLASMFASAAAGLTGNLFAGTIKSASNLNETISKTQTIFGDVSGSIISQADAMSAKFGLPKQAMLDAASAMGLMAKGAGQSGDETAAFSNKMVKLAADAMSFYNVPFDEALNKIRSGLSGESEPLRAFGVFLTEDAVKAEAASMGIAKLGADLTEGQKIMARSSLIAKGLGDATGDLDRTFSGTENQTRAFWGTLANLGQDIGSVMMPAFNSLLEVASSAMRGLAGLWQENKAAFAGWVASVVEGVKTAQAIWSNFGDLIEIALLTAARSWVEFSSSVQSVAATIAGYLLLPGEYLVRGFATAITAVGSLWDGLMGKLGTFADVLLRPIRDLTNALGLTSGSVEQQFESYKGLFSAPAEGARNFSEYLGGLRSDLAGVGESAAIELGAIDSQIDAITGRMADKAAAAATGAVQTASGQAKKFEQQQAAGKADKADKAAKAEVMDTAEFARKLNLSAISGGDDTPKKQLAAAEKTAKHTEEIAAAAKSPRLAVLG